MPDTFTPNLNLDKPAISAFDIWGAKFNSNMDIIDAASATLRGTPVSNVAPTTGQSLVFNGTNWAPANFSPALATNSVFGVSKLSVAAASGGNPISVGDNDPRMSDSRNPVGAASGDLSGTYPSPTVAKLQGQPVSSASPTSGQALVFGSNWAPATLALASLSDGANVLLKSGGTMTGSLILNADPSVNLGAATKQYADAGLALKVAKAGDTMTGLLILSADPSANLGAATKQYADAGVALKVSKAGDTMTGFLFLSADPTSGLHAATKNYVDSGLAAKQATGSYLTALTGDVTASGPGSAAAAVAFVGGVSAANVSAGASAANAAASVNTASTIVKRDVSGNFSAGTIAATFSGNLTGSVTGAASANVLKSGDTMTGTLILPSNGLAVGGTQLVAFGGSIGVGTATPDASAVLELSSTTKGFLPPRMTQTQRDAISGPANSLLIYDITSGEYEYWNGTSWVVLSASAPGSGVSGSASAGQVTVWSGTNVIGGDPQFFWNTTSKRLGANVASPAYTLDVGGDANVSGVYRVGGSQIAASNLSDYSNILLANGTHPLSANLNANGFTVTSVATPVNPSDASNKAYVDSVAQGLSVKQSVRALAASNITLSGTQTIDGVGVLAGDRVLATAQTSAVNNGIYIVAAGAWSRSADMAAASNAAGAFAFVEEGTVYAQTGWVCNDPSGAAIVGTNSLGFTQFSQAGVITAGTGLTKVGNTISLSAPVAVSNGGTGAASLAGTGALVMNSGGTAVTSVVGTSSGQTLRWSGSAWLSAALASTDLSDTVSLIRTSTTLSGDLSGTLPGATVAKVNGVTFNGSPSAGQFPVATSSTAASWQTISSANLSDSATIIKSSGTPISGQVAFWNSANTESGSANLQWDNTNFIMSVGGSPVTTLAIGVQLSASTTTGFAAATSSSTQNSFFAGLRSGGTQGSPTATPVGDNLVEFQGLGHNGTSFIFSPAGNLRFVSTETWSLTGHGTSFALDLIPTGSTTKTQNVMFAVGTGTGRVGFGGNTSPSFTLDATGDANVSGLYRVGGSQIASSNLSDGASLVKGSGLAANGVLVMNSGNTAATSVAPGTSGNALVSNGTTWVSQAVSATPAGAAGNIQFNSTPSAGSFSADANLNWNPTNISLVIGGFPSNLGTPIPGSEAIGNGQASGFISTVFNSAGDGPVFVGLRANGTQSSPTSVIANQKLINIVGSGYVTGSGFDFVNDGGHMQFRATETWTTGAHGTEFRMNLCQNGSNSAASAIYASVVSGAARFGVGTFTPAFPADVVGDINTSTAYKIGGTLLASTNLSDTATITYTANPMSITGTAAAGQNLVAQSSSTAAWKSPVGSIATNGVSTTYTATATDNVILCNATTAPFTVTLPAEASSGKKVFNIKKIDSSTNTVTVQANGAETIDGSNTVSITIQYQSFQIVCDGSTWWVI